MSVFSSFVTGLRAVAAAGLVGHSFFRPAFSSLDSLRLLLAYQPELTVAALVLESFPAVVGGAWILRALRPQRLPCDGSFAAAGRWAALLGMAGLVFLPLHASDPESALRELGLRALAFLGLTLMLDGPLTPAR